MAKQPLVQNDKVTFSLLEYLLEANLLVVFYRLDLKQSLHGYFLMCSNIFNFIAAQKATKFNNLFNMWFIDITKAFDRVSLKHTLNQKQHA